MNLTATPKRTDAKPYINHVGVAMAEVFPAIVAYNESDGDLEKALYLEGRLADLEHACKIARGVL